MPEAPDIALLPAGLRDGLPPDAAYEAAVVERLLAFFAGYGYERVKPPLVEFETTLLAGAGQAVRNHTFRLMDPVSQRMMGLRADITPQIARLATTRLARAPRPLRLSYAGEVLRVRGTQLVPEREILQVGAEMVGAVGTAADAEVVAMAAAAVGALGVSRLTADLTAPTLVPALAAALGVDSRRAATLRAALDQKDAAGVRAAAGEHGAVFEALLDAAGPAEDAFSRLGRLALPDGLGLELADLAAVVSRLREAQPELGLTVDPVENRGFEYHTGISFALFAPGVRGELGRGGRYVAGPAPGEAATGVTLVVETLMRALKAPERAPRLFLPAGIAAGEAARLRGEGWSALQGLESADPAAEARRLGCTHLWRDGRVAALDGPKE